MNAIEILSQLEKVKFTTEQARTITSLFEEHHNRLDTKDDIKMIRKGLENTAIKDELNASIAEAKYDLVRWIVGRSSLMG